MKKTKMNITDYYTYSITWSEGDQEYVGLCAEFPGLSWLDESFDEALIGIRMLVADVVADMGSNNEPIPQPISLKKSKPRGQC
jgi:predicted RNase H-like HicB family nuclease